MKKALVCAVALPAVAGVAQAANDQANLGVSANVPRVCRVWATTTVDFGDYDPVFANETTALDGQGNVEIRCTKGYVPTVGLDLGLNASGSTRRMSGSGSDYLAYELYKDASRSAVWGDSGADLFTPPSSPGASGTSYNVYGRVAAGQDVAEGAYDDTVVVTVNF